MLNKLKKIKPIGFYKQRSRPENTEKELKEGEDVILEEAL